MGASFLTPTAVAVESEKSGRKLKMRQKNLPYLECRHSTPSNWHSKWSNILPPMPRRLCLLQRTKYENCQTKIGANLWPEFSDFSESPRANEFQALATKSPIVRTTNLVVQEQLQKRHIRQEHVERRLRTCASERQRFG